MSTTNKTYLDLNGLTQYDEKIKEYIEYTEITYEDWLELTDEEKETGKWYVTGVPGADGTVSIDLMTKLWENPSPTADFAAQSLTLDLSGYDLIVVIALYGMVCVVKNVVGQELTLSEAASGAGGTVLRRRIGTITATGITWQVGYYSTSWEAGIASASVLKPNLIYGIKLHHTVEIKAIAPEVSTLASKCMMSDGVTSVEDAVEGLTSGLTVRLPINVTLPATTVGRSSVQLDDVIPAGAKVVGYTINEVSTYGDAVCINAYFNSRTVRVTMVSNLDNVPQINCNLVVGITY